MEGEFPSSGPLERGQNILSACWFLRWGGQSLVFFVGKARFRLALTESFPLIFLVFEGEKLFSRGATRLV